MKVFVTGGTGFIGGEVVRQLRDRGDDVVCLVRTPEKAGKLTELGCELISGDLGDGDAILWAGPGHQDYRDIRGVRTPYSARELARRALADAGWPVTEPHWPVPYPADSTPLSDPKRDWR